MATYTELYDLAASGSPESNGLIDRVAVAVSIKAHDYLTYGASTTAQRTWAANAVANPRSMAMAVWPLVLAANESATVAQIQNATDAAIQTNVDAVASALADGQTA